MQPNGTFSSLQSILHTFVGALAILATSPAPSHASGEWPARPVTIIVPFVAGGNTDMMARLAAERLAAKFGHPFVIENIGGAGGVIAASQVARAAPDGYTLLFGAGSQLTLAPLVQKITYPSARHPITSIDVQEVQLPPA
jgi:tripartite-type tricarboxylate transporter receptor subunit TctC